MNCKACGSYANPVWKVCLVCDEPIGFDGLENADLSTKWQDYLLERVDVVTKYEGYTQEQAQEEVIKMIPYYRGLN